MSNLKILVLDGHPDKERLSSHLLDYYCEKLPKTADITRINVRDLTFDPVLHKGFSRFQEWEGDVKKVATAIQDCDHLVIGFPLWWGAEPAPLKGLLDRILLPGFAYKYRRNSALCDKLLAGRTADVIITMDTPPWYLRSFYGDPVVKRWRKQILGFCGIAPVRMFRCGMTRRGHARNNIAKWHTELAMAARTAGQLKRQNKITTKFSENTFERQVTDRKS